MKKLGKKLGAELKKLVKINKMEKTTTTTNIRNTIFETAKKFGDNIGEKTDDELMTMLIKTNLLMDEINEPNIMVLLKTFEALLVEKIKIGLEKKS